MKGSLSAIGMTVREVRCGLFTNRAPPTNWRASMTREIIGR
jgi:hypothetical protein